jgi:hypothetical protein
MKKGIDGFFDFYPTFTALDLEQRLSEMFHLERRAYLISPSLQSLVLSLLDHIISQPVDTVINVGGVLTGYALTDLSDEEQLQLWISDSDGVDCIYEESLSTPEQGTAEGETCSS